MSDMDGKAPATLYYLSPANDGIGTPRVARFVAEGPLIVIARAVLAVPADWRLALWIESEGHHVTADELEAIVAAADATVRSPDDAVPSRRR